MNIAENKASATVISNYGEKVLVLTELGQYQHCFQRKSLDGLVAGDQVIIDSDEEVIIERLLRRNVFERPNDFGKIKPVAANIDQAFVVFSPAPEYSHLLLDRYLVALENKDIHAILVLNKTDLIDDSNRALIEETVSLYQSLDYQVIEASAEIDQGIDQISLLMENKNSVFLGQSGVGKSSLTNQLLPDAEQLVHQISGQSKLGQHTTTSAKLFPLKSGFIVDSPGIRDFLLWHLTEQDLVRGFVEFEHFAQQCKFRDCAHQQEPKCAVHAAVKSGEIVDSRWQSYQKIKQEIIESKHNKRW